MTLESFVTKQVSTTFPLYLFKSYKGLVDAKLVIPTDTFAIIMGNRSITLPQKVDIVGVVNNQPAIEIFCMQALYAVNHALLQRFDSLNFDVTRDGYDITVQFKNLTFKSEEIFGENYKFVVSADPQNPDKRIIKNGYYANKSMAIFIALQVNAALRERNPKTGKFSTLRCKKN